LTRYGWPSKEGLSVLLQLLMPAGRPSEFKEEYVAEVAEMASNGLTDLEIAESIGVNRTTLWRWSQVHPELCNALKDSKQIADTRVEQSLYSKALGGDTTAMIFWLKNRKSKEWRDKTETEITGNLAEIIAAARKR
jgi:hypothetical protein